jgi:putative endonuclease
MNGTHVYLLESLRHSGRRYVGLTRDLGQRLAEHNAGKVDATFRHKPGRIVAAIWFADRDRAEAFERYLKHGSGHAFAKSHFWSSNSSSGHPA